MSKFSPITVDLEKCHRQEDFEVWVDDLEGSVFFHHVPSGVSYSRIPRNLRGLPSGFVPARKAKARRRTSSGSSREACDVVRKGAEASAEQRTSGSPPSPSLLPLSKSPALGPAQASDSLSRSQQCEASQKDFILDASSSLLSLTDMRRESAISIAAMLQQLTTDKFRIWKKKGDAMELLEGRCSPCVKLLISHIPEELMGEWEVHNALQRLKVVLEGSSFNNTAKSSGKGIFKKVRTEGGVALASVKKAVRVLERHLQNVHEQDAESMCVSLDLLEQIFSSSSSGCEMWKALSSGALPDAAKEDEFCFSVPFLIVWRVLMQKVPSQWQAYGEAWKTALQPLLGCEEAGDAAPSSVNAKQRVTALAFSDFVVLFAPLDTWWAQVRKLLGTPEFFWFERGPISGNANDFVKKPRVGNFLFRFSGSKRRRIVLQFISEMAMRAAELQGGPRLSVKWESAAVDVVAGRQGGLCQYQFLGERYESLNAIVAAFSEHFKVPADKSRFCSWFWADPVSREAVVASIGRGGEGSFAIVRTKSERASYALFHNGPEGARDYLIDQAGGAFSVEFDGHLVTAPTMAELVYAACAHGRLSNGVPRPQLGASLRERLTTQPTVYFAGNLTAST